MRAALAAMVTGLLLLACGGTDSNHPAAGSAAQELFPLVPGARWTYQIRAAELGNLELEYHARGMMDLPKGNGKVFVVDETNTGPNMGFVETQPVGYFVTDEGYLARLTALDYDDDGKLIYVGVEEPAWMLPLEPEAGHAWGQMTKMFQTPEGGGGDLGWSGEVIGSAAVSVPAGDFAEATEVRLTYRNAGDPGVEPLLIYYDYYVRGVGLVRSVAEDPAGDPGKKVETLLKSFEFPN